MFVTYELKAEGKRGAREFVPPGPVVHWEVGDFALPAGGRARGVRVEYADPVIGPTTEVIEVPPGSSHVEVYLGDLPEAYRKYLRSRRAS